MTNERIPEFREHTRQGMAIWFAKMRNRDLIFHPEDSPHDIVDMTTGRALFTSDECMALDRILKTMFDKFGSGVCDACYPGFMAAAGFASGH